MKELVTEAYAIDGATVKLGWFKRAPLMLVGYDSGRYAVVYLEPTGGKGNTIPVELVSVTP